MKKIHCISCLKEPKEITEYISSSEELGISPEQYVIEEEGTYNSELRVFCCTYCYILKGCPSSPKGWKAGEKYYGK